VGATSAGRSPRSGAPTSHLAVVGSIVLLTSIAAFFRVPLLPSIGVELRMGPVELGFITTVFAIGRIVTDIPAGRLTDRIRTLTLMSASSVVLAGGSLLMATARTPTVVLASAFVLGIASSVANTTGMTYFSTARAAERRGRTLALYSASLLVGQALGPTVGGALAQPFGWRGALTASAMVAGAILVVSRLAAVVLRPPIATGRDRRAATAASSGARTEVATSPPLSTDARRQIRILMLAPFTIFFVLGSLPQTLIPIIGDARYGLTPAAIGIALGVGGVSRLVGVLVGGRVADLVGRKIALIPGLVLSAAGVLMLIPELGVAGWVAAIVLLSLGTSGIGVAATMVTDLCEGHDVGRHLGAYRMFGDLGLITGPAVATAVYVRAGQAATAMTVTALIVVSLVLTMTLVRETHGVPRHD